MNGVNRDPAERRHPHLGDHVRILAFRQDDTRESALPVERDDYQGQRQGIWDMAAGLIGLCPRLETLIWETGFGVDNGMWKVRGRRTPQP